MLKESFTPGEFDNMSMPDMHGTYGMLPGYARINIEGYSFYGQDILLKRQLYKLNYNI